MDQLNSSNGLDDEQFVEPEALESLEPFESYKVYLLKRIFASGYDEYVGKVIVASSAKAARKLANLKYGGEGPIWTDSNQVLCREITLTMPLIVLEAFRAG